MDHDCQHLRCALTFFKFVNSVTVISLSDTIMYADDTDLHFSHSDLSVVENILHADVENVSTWLIVNRLRLNVIQSLCMLIGSCQRTKGQNLTLALNRGI